MTFSAFWHVLGPLADAIGCRSPVWPPIKLSMRAFVSALLGRFTCTCPGLPMKLHDLVPWSRSEMPELQAACRDLLSSKQVGVTLQRPPAPATRPHGPGGLPTFAA